jgi:hypothetical protein
MATHRVIRPASLLALYSIPLSRMRRKLCRAAFARRAQLARAQNILEA